MKGLLYLLSKNFCKGADLMNIVKWKCLINWFTDHGFTYQEELILDDPEKIISLTKDVDFDGDDNLYIDSFIFIPYYEK